MSYSNRHRRGLPDNYYNGRVQFDNGLDPRDPDFIDYYSEWLDREDREDTEEAREEYVMGTLSNVDSYYGI